MMGDYSDELGLSWNIPQPGVDQESIDRLRRKYDPRHLTAGERLELLSLSSPPSGYPSQGVFKDHSAKNLHHVCPNLRNEMTRRLLHLFARRWRRWIQIGTSRHFIHCTMRSFEGRRRRYEDRC
jgi:hypothetical protein